MSTETDNPGAQGAEPTGGAQPSSAAAPSSQPTATVGRGEQTASHRAGTAQPEGGIPLTERPEAQVGAAFAGGLLLALILRRLGS